MDDKNERTAGRWLFHPFRYVAGARSLCIGLLAMILTAFLGWLTRAHFDGVLDLHIGRGCPLWLFLSEGLLDWGILATTLSLLGVVQRAKFRLVDLFGTQAFARWPGLIPVLLLLVSPIREGFLRFADRLQRQPSGVSASYSVSDVLCFGTVTLVILGAIIWMVLLMYRAYSTSCNAKGPKAVLSFVASVVVAETLSKVCLWQILKHIQPE